MTNLEELAIQRAKLEAELAKIASREERLLAASDDTRLAESLHDLQCTWNHTDGCGWFYEFNQGEPIWNGWAHARYLKKARKVMKLLPDLSVDEILRVVKIIK